MSDAPDPLEQELAALRPSGVTPDLKRRVSEQLDPPARSVSDGQQNSRRLRSGLVWGLVVFGVLTAIVVLVLGPSKKNETPAPVPPVVVPVPAPEVESPAPSVLVYQQALARSPEQLTALLDKHATAAPDNVPVSAFTRSKTTLDALIGDD